MLQDTLVKLIYDAVDNRRARRDFLAAFTEITDSAAAAIILQDKRLRWAVFCASYGISPETRSAYETHWVALNPWALRRPQTAGQTRIDGDVLTEREFRDTEFYHGMYRPVGWAHSSSLIIHSADTEFSMLCAYRPAGHPFTEREREIYQNVAPHLATAVRIELRLKELKEIIDSSKNGSREIEALADMDLSPAETKVALALLHGQTPKEYAQRAHLSVGTVRAHIKGIYRTLGVHRQADLIRVLLDHRRRR